jgi:uncharacterized protein YbjQ (UPF0145 family)
MAWFFRPRGERGAGSLPPPDSRYQPLTSEEVVRDQEALDEGRLPERVVARISRTGRGELPWVQGATVTGFGVLEGLGFEPVAQVAGNCSYNAASDQWQNVWLDSNHDASNLIHAYYAAKARALERLRQEAELVGAHAVFGARPDFERLGSVVECRVVGTAVRFRGWTGSVPALPISPLPPEEALKLIGRGYFPVGFALGYHWHCMPVGFQTQIAASAWNVYNQELQGVTERLSETRKVAQRRLLQDAREVPGAIGVVGVRIATRLEETEIRYAGGFPGQGFYIDGTYYQYEANGVVDVPAFNVEIWLTGTVVAKLQQSQGGTQVRLWAGP